MPLASAGDEGDDGGEGPEHDGGDAAVAYGVVGGQRGGQAKGDAAEHLKDGHEEGQAKLAGIKGTHDVPEVAPRGAQGIRGGGRWDGQRSLLQKVRGFGAMAQCSADRAMPQFRGRTPNGVIGITAFGAAVAGPRGATGQAVGG